ncbi:two-component response regulator-like APRR2 [Pyrus x bretschneideri]|uniref:two-component response regulator-like APRR2 n=1 Tax=Pyrus x bretschneideri TaxID=225117 RepID=UPI0020305B18|nr:two-component response regulator-like APRR2 [Pyrus x bretschneideri]XP_048447528.1 two-component response regulator-like APRR2 [Pyrus x bretschneideri]XP_048447529.1 two-component response regulator-like APRR2 [Pyrus x bretschneideri]XP_048447530.1 two-component response regulator-like APRR2 [Pyrus x bretschneideri]
MVCTANDLQEWKDFPKGLRVLLLDGDTTSASQIRSKLEAMDYIVTAFCNENEALSAFSSNPESFHVAIIEVNANNGHLGFQFLETAKELPIIMTSNIHCLSTMMKCIALGAVEFLRKPLSEDKLRNIWQHVVHKAFNAGGSVISETLKPVKESLVSMVQPKQENEEQNCKISKETENVLRVHENDQEQSAGCDKYPAPSTPQLKQVSRLLDHGDCQDQINCLSEKESGEHDIETKSVENTCNNPIDEGNLLTSEPHLMLRKTAVKKENDSGDGSKSQVDMSHHPDNIDSGNDNGGAAENLSKASVPNSSCKSNRKKMKVDWTSELHKKFVQAVEQLGVDQAIPSRILDLMKTEGLTRHNVASHLQKYRMHKRHILPKEEDRRLLQPHHTRDPIHQRSYYPYSHRPIMAFPPYHYTNPTLSMPPAYPMWGSQPPASSHPATVQMWGQPGYPHSQWQPSDQSWQYWNPYPGLQADAWGCPVMPPEQGGYSSYPQNTSGFQNAGGHAVENGHGYSMPQNSFDIHPAEEVVDKVVKEAMSKPWLPLPLGLKPPSTEGVLAELTRQGICNIPQINGSNTR